MRRSISIAVLEMVKVYERRIREATSAAVKRAFRCEQEDYIRQVCNS